MEDYHVYVHIHSQKVGEKTVKEIVPASSIKKFDINKYLDDPDFYKNKPLKLIKEGEKVVCSILHVGETYEEVDTHVKTTNRRFRIPRVNLSSIDTSQDGDETTKQELQKTKKTRKMDKQNKKALSKEVSEEVVQAYIDDGQNSQNSDNEQNLQLLNQQFSSEIPESDAELSDLDNTRQITQQNSSTPLRTLPLSTDTLNELRSSNNAYKKQALYFKEKFEKSERERKQLELQQSQKNYMNQNENAIAQEQYNQVFGIKNNNQNSDSTSRDMLNPLPGNKIHIKKEVYCNELAYKDAFKTKSCQKFFTYMNKGIYGDELAERTYRIQKGTERFRELSPVKREVVEDEFYRYLVVRGYPPNLINVEMNRCSTYHHVSITSARRRLKRRLPNPVNQE